MVGENKTHLTEKNIIPKSILPAVKTAGWDVTSHARQKVKLRNGKILALANWPHLSMWNLPISCSTAYLTCRWRLSKPGPISTPSARDSNPFGTAMANLTGRTIESASYVHLRLYKAITRQEDHQKA